MKIKLSLFFILVATSTLLAQELGSTVLKGRINANIIDLEGIYVFNLRTEKSTMTDKDGLFAITAIPGDTLLFSSIQLKQVRIVLELKDFKDELFLLKMETMITQLREVVIKRYDGINAVDLGISPSGMKHRTPEERKLYTATSTAGDALLNFMSGRTAMLKKEIVVEGKLSSINQIENMFNEEYFRKTLKIPAEYVKGFQYYLVDNERFTTILKSKNKTQIEFALVSLAEKYNLIISSEK